MKTNLHMAMKISKGYIEYSFIHSGMFMLQGLELISFHFNLINVDLPRFLQTWEYRSGKLNIPFLFGCVFLILSLRRNFEARPKFYLSVCEGRGKNSKRVSTRKLSGQILIKHLIVFSVSLHIRNCRWP